MKKQFAAAGTRSQVLQALALLVESGSMYCVLMVSTIVAALLKTSRVTTEFRCRRSRQSTKSTQCHPKPAQASRSPMWARTSRTAASYLWRCVPTAAATPARASSRGVLTKFPQAIYPAVIIVLVALRRSPIDTVQACSLGLVREDTPSTFTLHHAPSRSSAGTDVEGAGAVDGISAGDRRRARSLELVRDVWR